MLRRRLILAATFAGLALATLTAGPACNKPAPGAPTPPAPGACNPTPGTTCYGKLNYVEFVAGDFPLVISVPHGGALTPSNIPDRTVGTTVTDSNTVDLGRAIVQAFASRTGRRPHLVICHLRRTKLDANREISEAAQGNADAMQSWNDYHGFVELATTTVISATGRGFYLDLHGHGHAIQRLELGYLLTSAQLDLSDTQLNAAFGGMSSLRLALPLTASTFAEILRGQTSLGGLLGPATPSVPSPAAPSPGTDPYFEGGYSTERHTARLAGLQIESNFTGVRDNASNRAAFADKLAAALVTFLETHLALR